MLVVFASSFLVLGALSATCDECWNNYWDCDWNAQSLAWEECSKIWEEGSEYAPFDRQCIEEQAAEQVDCYSNAGCFEAGNQECWWKLWELGCDPYKCEAYNICYQTEMNNTNCDNQLNECEQNCDDSGYDNYGGYDSFDSYNYYDSFGDYNDYGDSYNFDYYDNSYNNYDSFDSFDYGYNYNYYGPEQQEWQYAYDEIPDCIKTKCGDVLDQCASSDSCVEGIENVANKCYMDYDDPAQCMDDTFINIDISNNGNEEALALCNGDEICSNDLQALGECIVSEANYGQCQSVTDCKSLKGMVKLVRGRRANLVKQRKRGNKRNQRVRPRSQLRQRRQRGRRQRRGRRAARRQ